MTSDPRASPVPPEHQVCPETRETRLVGNPVHPVTWGHRADRDRSEKVVLKVSKDQKVQHQQLVSSLYYFFVYL